MTADRTQDVVMGAIVALLCTTIAAWGISGYLSRTRNDPPARAAEVFRRNDTLFVCDRGACRFVDTRWTRCPKGGEPR